MDLIKKLSSISVDDLKNIDLESMKGRLRSNPGLLLNIIIISLTIIIMITTFRSQAKTAKTLKDDVTKLKEKVEAVDKSKLTRAKYNEFLKNALQTVSENRLIEMLSEIALKRGVRIISFSPANKSNNSFVNLTNVEITVTSMNYADVIRFINDIENSVYLIRIGKWTGVSKIQEQSSQRYSRKSELQVKPEDEYLETKVKIETVEFKYE